MMRRLANDWLPPALLRGVRRARRALWRDRSLYSTYEDALTVCRGYEEDVLADIVLEKTRRLKAELSTSAEGDGGFELDLTRRRLLLGLLTARTGDRLNVLDFGGSCGAQAFIARTLLPDDVELRWHIVETPTMAARAQSISDERLRFFTSIDEAAAAFDEPIDLAMASCSLQYMPNPVETLGRLTRLGAEHVYITRAGLSDEPGLDNDLITVQKSWRRLNGPGPLPGGYEDGPTSFPLVISPRSAFERVIEERYDLLWRIREQRRVYVFDRHEIDLWGLMARRRKETAAGTNPDGREESCGALKLAA